MNAYGWKQQIIRAAADPEGEVMTALAAHLAECTEAKSILRFKGYGESGHGIAVMAQAIPVAYGR